MLKLKPYSVSFLVSGGLLLVAMGIYFIFLRPPILPEDYRYIGTTFTDIQENIPKLSVWLQKIFWVMGSYIISSGLLTIYIALTTFRIRTKGAFIIITVSGLTSIGFMTIVNFIINSDFKWTLFVFTIPWIISLILYRLRK